MDQLQSPRSRSSSVHSSAYSFEHDPHLEHPHHDVDPNSIQSSVFGVLYVMLKDITVAPLWTMIMIVIDFFQVVSFAVLPTFAWHQPYITWLQVLVNPFGISTSNFLFYLALSVVVLVLLNFAFVWHMFQRNEFEHIWALRLLRLISALICQPLFIPIINIFVLQVACLMPDNFTTNSISPACSASSSQQSMMAAVGIVFGVLFSILCVVICATYYSRDPFSSHPLARSSSRIIVAQLLLRLLLSVVYPFVTDWIKIILFCGGCCLIAFLYTYYLPLYNMRFNMFRICEYFMLSWVGFCLLVVQSVNARDQTGLTVMMYLLLPVIAYLGHLLAEVRKRQMMEVDANILTSPLEFELKGRLLMEPIMVTMQDKFTGRSPEKTALTAEQVELNEDKLTRLLQDVESLYNMGCTKFPTSTMFLLRAQFHIYFHSVAVSTSHGAAPSYSAISDLNKSEHSNAGFDELFSIFYLRHLQEERFNGESHNKDVIGFIEFNKCLADAQKWDAMSCQAQLDFWTQLAVPLPDLQLLVDLSSRINKNIVLCHRAYEKLMQLPSQNGDVLRMYASFLSDIVSDDKQSKKMMLKADQQDELRKSQGGSTGNLLLQHSDNVATFFVSGHAYDQGCITDVNVACLKLLGYSRAELEGRDMSMLLPSPYDQTHSTLLQHFLNSNMDAENIHQNQQLYLRHKNGCIIPIDVLVRQIFTAAGSAFLVLCSPKQTSDYFVVLNPENVVTACTAEFAAVFSQNLPQIANGTVRISSVIKSFDVHESKMQHPNGIAIDQVVNESNAKFVLYLSTLSFANPSPTLQQWRMLRITPVLPTATLLRKKSSPFITTKSLVPIPETTFQHKHSPRPQILSRVADELLAAVQRSPRPEGQQESNFRSAMLPQTSFRRQPYLQSVQDIQPTVEWVEMDAPKFQILLNGNTMVAASPSQAATQPSTSSTASQLSAGPSSIQMSPLSLSSSPSQSTLASPASMSHATLLPQMSPYRTMSAKIALPPKLERGSTTISMASTVSGSSDRDEKLSQAASQTSTSASARTAVWQQKLKIALLNMQNQTALSPSLRRVYYLLLAMTILTIAWAITQYFVIGQQFSAYSAALSYLTQAAKRRYVLVLTASMSYELLLQNLNMLNANQAASNSQLKRYLSTMQNAHTALFHNLALPKSAAQNSLYSSSKFSIAQLDVSSTSFSISTINLNDGIQKWFSAVQRITTVPQSQLSLSHPDIYFLLQNHAALLSQLNTSTNLYVEETSGSVSQMKLVILSVSLAPILMVLLFFIVVIPSISQVECHKNGLLVQLLLVPGEVISDFQQKCHSHMQRLSYADLDNDVDGENSSPIGSARNYGGPSTPSSPTDSPLARIQMGRRKSLVGNAASSFSNGSKTSVNGEDIRSTASVGRSMSWQVLKKLVFVLLTTIFFSSAYWIEFGAFENKLRSAPNNINAAELRSSSIHSLAFNLERLASQQSLVAASSFASALPSMSFSSLPGTFSIPMVNVSDAVRDLTLLEYFQHYLLYTVEAQDAVQSGYQYGSDCLAGSPADCSTWQSGLMSLGLAPALSTYTSTARSLLDVMLTVNNGNYSITLQNATLHSPEMQFIDSFDRYYSTLALDASIAAYSDLNSSTYQADTGLRLGIMNAFIGITILLYATYYYPLVHRLNDETRRICSIFVMLPSSVLDSMSKTTDIRALLEGTFSSTDMDSLF